MPVFSAQPLFDLIAAVAAEAVLRADLAAAAFAARAKLRAAAGAVQMLHALRRAAVHAPFSLLLDLTCLYAAAAHRLVFFCGKS